MTGIKSLERFVYVLLCHLLSFSKIVNEIICTCGGCYYNFDCTFNKDN